MNQERPTNVDKPTQYIGARFSVCAGDVDLLKQLVKHYGHPYNMSSVIRTLIRDKASLFDELATEECGATNKKQTEQLDQLAAKPKRGRPKKIK